MQSEHDQLGFSQVSVIQFPGQVNNSQQQQQHPPPRQYVQFARPPALPNQAANLDPFMGLSLSDIDSASAMLPYILNQQQLLLAQQQQQQLTPDETRDILITIHHTCQDIKDSLRTLHSRMEEMWNEMSIIRQKQEIIELNSGVEIQVVDDFEAEVPDDEEGRVNDVL